MKKLVRGWVREARYFEQEKSLILILEEVESRRKSKPVQVSIATFKKAGGMTVSDDDADAWRHFAKLLMRRSEPVAIEFDVEDGHEQGPDRDR